MSHLNKVLMDEFSVIRDATDKRLEAFFEASFSFLGAGLQTTVPEVEYAKLSKCGKNICSGSGNLIMGIIPKGFPESLKLLGRPCKIQLGNPLDGALCLPI